MTVLGVKEKKLTKQIEKIEEDYLNSSLYATDHKRLNTKLLVEIGKIVKDISRLERQISTIPKVDFKTL